MKHYVNLMKTEFIDIITLYTISVKGIYTSDYDSREKIETKEESG